MPSVGPRCHELRVTDENRIWRVIYRIDRDKIVIADTFSKTTRKTSPEDIKRAKDRLNAYDRAVKAARGAVK
jgi:phage-related protein